MQYVHCTSFSSVAIIWEGWEGYEEIEYPWRKMRHENSIENWHEGGRNSIGGHRDLRVNGRGAGHVLQALDVVLERIGHKGLGLHAHVLMIEL